MWCGRSGVEMTLIRGIFFFFFFDCDSVLFLICFFFLEEIKVEIGDCSDSF